VKINDIIFTQGVDDNPGNIATSDYDPGLDGWKIDGDGSAEFNNVVVRGTIVSTEGEIADLTINATQLLFDRDGAEVSIDTGVVNRTLTGLSGLYETAGFYINEDNYFILITQGDFSPIDAFAVFRTSSQAVFANTTESDSIATGSIITLGGMGIAKNLRVGGAGSFTGALNAPLVSIKDVDADPYPVIATDTHVAVDTSITTTINLPAGTEGRRVTIFDSLGTASIGNITIDADGAEEINGAGTTTLTTDYQSVTLLFTAGNWVII
jgi:hypothetical protein